uniref:Uncharacterized protein n=1 Tax=Chromera velia CCMP2878 TaxID=1169474 RepID=A0A0G4HPS8_9ALVE|eukprot:Cvel_1228.t1-p1 / transcript=Cvel_1228.t1 / gene=Cvel_1228 / organism=Chromera_velia_CCMP2878 / gene_product=hypothetical protein / transcript_product=hypothetical protein / location=Cvel_scaffold41:30745-32785(+) / protein_length=645 / sequence_SO=supercontig / SO=protein_coding / is_pseudo=false
MAVPVTESSGGAFSAAAKALSVLFVAQNNTQAYSSLSPLRGSATKKRSQIEVPLLHLDRGWGGDCVPVYWETEWPLSDETSLGRCRAHFDFLFPYNQTTIPEDIVKQVQESNKTGYTWTSFSALFPANGSSLSDSGSLLLSEAAEPEWQEINTKLDVLIELGLKEGEVQQVKSRMEQLRDQLKDPSKRLAAGNAVLGGLTGTIDAIKSGKPANIISSVLGTAAAVAGVASAVPGAAAVSLALGFFSAIAGLFGGGAGSSGPPPLTREDIADVVQEELWKNSLKERGNDMIAYAKQLLGFAQVATNYAMEAKEKGVVSKETCRTFRDLAYDSWGPTVQHSAPMLTGFYTDLESRLKELSNLKESERMCKNTCDLMISPYHKWKEAKGHKVDFSYSKSWGYWPDSDSMCVEVGKSISRNKECKKRIQRRDQCHKDFETSASNWNPLRVQLQGALALSQAELLMYIAIRDFFASAKVKSWGVFEKSCAEEQKLNVEMFLQSLGSQMDDHIWKLMTWSPERAGKWAQGGKEYDCQAENDDWLETVGGENGGYSNVYEGESRYKKLKNAPCVTSEYCTNWYAPTLPPKWCLSGPKGSWFGGTNDMFKCDEGNETPGYRLDWEWTGGVWKYSEIEGPEMPTGFSMFDTMLF